jgi:hypothetical protein
MKKIRPPRELPIERLVLTEELAGVIGEHPVTALNKANPTHRSFDADHPRPIKGPPGAPARWWLPDAYRYIDTLRRRSAECEQKRDDVDTSQPIFDKA